MVKYMILYQYIQADIVITLYLLDTLVVKNPPANTADTRTQV